MGKFADMLRERQAQTKSQADAMDPSATSQAETDRTAETGGAAENAAPKLPGNVAASENTAPKIPDVHKIAADAFKRSREEREAATSTGPSVEPFFPGELADLYGRAQRSPGDPVDLQDLDGDQLGVPLDETIERLVDYRNQVIPYFRSAFDRLTVVDGLDEKTAFERLQGLNEEQVRNVLRRGVDYLDWSDPDISATHRHHIVAARERRRKEELRREIRELNAQRAKQYRERSGGQ